MTDRLGDKIRLQHILEAINEIDTFIKDIDFVQFSSNSMGHFQWDPPQTHPNVDPSSLCSRV